MPTLADLYPELYGYPAQTLRQNRPGLITDIRRGYGGLVSGVGSSLQDVPGLEGIGEYVEQYGEGVQQRNPGQIHSFGDVVDRPFTALREGVGEMAPQLGAAAGGAFTGARLGGLVGGPPGAVVGGIAGALVPIFAQEYGEVRGEQRRQGLDDRPRAFAAATGATALELLGPEAYILGRVARRGVGMTEQAARDIAQQGFFPYAGRQALKQGVIEGPLTEIPQTAIERWGSFQETDSPEAWSDYGVAGVKGFAGGSVFGSATKSMERLGLQSRLNFMDQALSDPTGSGQAYLDALDLKGQFSGTDPEALARQRAEFVRQYMEKGTATGQPIDLLKAVSFTPDPELDIGVNPYNVAGHVSQLAKSLDSADARAPFNPLSAQYDLFGGGGAASGFSAPYVQAQPASASFAPLAPGQPMQAFPHQGQAMPAATDVEVDVSRAASVLAAAVRGANVLPADKQWAEQTLQRHLSPAQYKGFLGNLQTSTKSGSTTQKPAGQQPKASGAGQPDTNPFVAAYKEAGGIYSPVQGRLAQAKSEQEALAVVRDVLENKKPSQKVMQALEKLHVQLSGESLTDYLRRDQTTGGQFFESWVSDPKEAATERQRIVDWLSTPHGKQLTQTLATRDREFLELVQTHGANFAAIGKTLGMDATAVRRRLVGRRDASGNLAMDPRGGVKQVGLLDRLGKAAVEQGLSVEGLASAPHIVRQAHRAKLGLPEEPVEAQDRNLAQPEAQPAALSERSRADVRQWLLAQLASQDPRRAEAFAMYTGWGDGNAYTLTEIGERLSISKQRAHQLVSEAQASAKALVERHGIQPEQFRDEEDDSAGTSSLVTTRKDAAAAGIEDPEAEEGSIDQNTGFTEGPIGKVNSPNITGKVPVNANKEVTVGEDGRPVGFVPDQEGKVNERARAFDEAVLQGDAEAEASLVWDSAAHHYAAQGERMRNWEQLAATEQGQQTQKAWVEFYKQKKQLEPKQGDIALLAKIRELLRSKYYAQYTDTEFAERVGELKPVSPFDNAHLLRALAKRFADGYGPFLKDQIFGYFTAAKLPGDAMAGKFDTGMFENKYVVIASERVWRGEVGATPAYLIERMFHHELEHVIDDVGGPHPGIYSSSPLLIPGGILYQEIGPKWSRDRVAFSLFSYPMDRVKYPMDRKTFMIELYAQLMSAYHTPALRGALREHFPNAYAFAEVKDEEIRAQMAAKRAGTDAQGSAGTQSEGLQAPAGNGIQRTVDARADGRFSRNQGLGGDRKAFKPQLHEGFAKAVEEVEAAVKSGDRVRRDRALAKTLPISRTPVVLRAVTTITGEKPFRKSDFVLGNGSTIYLKGQDEHESSSHGSQIPLETLKRLPQLLADPVAVFRSGERSSDPNSYKVLLDASVAGKPIVAALKPNRPQQEFQGETAHFTATVFPLGGGWEAVQTWSELGLLRYYDDKRPQAVSSGTYPQGPASGRGATPNFSVGVSKSPVKVVTKSEIEATPAAYWSKGLKSAAEFKEGDVITFRLPWVGGEEATVTGVIGKEVELDADGREVNDGSGTPRIKVSYVVAGKTITNSFTPAQLRRGLIENHGQSTSRFLHSKGLSDPFDVDALKARAVTTLADTWAKYKPTLLTLHQLVDQYGEKMTALREYVSSMDRMEQRQQTLMNRAHPTLTKWQQLHGHVRNSLNGLMLEATTRGIHPDEGFGAGTPNEHVADQNEYLALKRRFDALPSEAKLIYKEARTLLDDNWKARKEAFSRAVATAYKKLIDDANAVGDVKQVRKLEQERDKEIAEHARKVSSIKGPYFPLMRFGDYLLIAESDELRGVRDQLEDVTGKQHMELTRRLEGLKKDPKHYVVRAFESRHLAEQAARRYGGMQTRIQLAEEHFRKLQPVSAGAVDRIGERLSAQFDKTTAAKLKRLITELYISTLPEHAALQRQLRRQGIEGATTDTLRAVAQTVEKDSFYLSRMEYADEITGNLFKLKQEAKAAGIDYQHVYSNIAARAALDFDYKPTPIQNFLARLSGVWHLGMSPAYLLTNSSQPWMITAPVLAGKFGLGRSFDALRSAWVDAAHIIVQSKRGGGAFADINFDGVPDAGERAALKGIMDRGQIDITQNVDLGLVADGVDPKFLKLWKAFAWTNHHIEASNRIVTGLAAYRLARQHGESHDRAAAYAFKLVVDTQLNYTDANAAYWMKRGVVPLGKLIFQFRKYQQGMLYLLARNAQLAFQGDKDAQRALGYLAAMQLAVAGAVGIPVVTAPLAALSLFLDEDDDEEGDLETQLRNYLADVMGPEAARAFWKGLPTLFGLDVSQRLGMGDFWKPLPFLRFTGRTGEEQVGQLLVSALGAPMGMLARMWDGARLFDKGDWQKGTEKLLPKMLADLVKAERYATEGMTTRAGSQVLRPDRFDGWDIAFRALGFAPVRETEHYEAAAAKEGVARTIDERRKQLIGDYASARLRGESASDATKAIDEFNARHPAKGLRIDRSTMLQAVQSRRRNEKERDTAGVRFPRNQRSLEGMSRFAY